MMSADTRQRNENALAGVDYSKIKPFKDLMVEVARRTMRLPEKRGVFITPATNGHGVIYECRGKYYGDVGYRWVATKEGLGNKAWIAMLLNQLGLEDPKGQFHFGGIGIDTFLMGANDCAAHGGMPVVCTDEVTCGSSEFFETPQAAALAKSFECALTAAECALGQGESASYKYLMNATPPVKYAPSLSVCVIGIASYPYITGEYVRPGDVLIGVPSSGLHANGISPLIRRVMGLPDGFLTKLNGRTVGEEALIPTRSYIRFVNALLNAQVKIHALLPITGGGIGKLASDSRFHYLVQSWLPEDKIPPLFRFMLEIGMPKKDIVETFNNGIGYVVIVPPSEALRVVSIGHTTTINSDGFYDPIVNGFYKPIEIGKVEEGEAGTYFAPWDLHLPPPGKE